MMKLGDSTDSDPVLIYHYGLLMLDSKVHSSLYCVFDIGKSHCVETSAVVANAYCCNKITSKTEI